MPHDLVWSSLQPATPLCWAEAGEKLSKGFVVGFFEMACLFT